MINTEIINADNYYIEGFVVSTPQPLTIEVSLGKFFTIHNVEKQETTIKELEDGTTKEVEQLIQVEEMETDEYSAFTFDIESDNLVNVIYDVYLLDLPSTSGYEVHIDRTEMDGNNVPFYEGEDTIKFLLMSFMVPPNTNTLDDVQINIKEVVRNNDSDSAE
ncbi:hypothetical protein ACFX4N_23565 [Priestia sp. YIM B13551]|uniref:hypothetical protein n=1 Tax=Priestia sp. YIM B13551 TaxID=3366306 RepID=UPI003671BC87